MVRDQSRLDTLSGELHAEGCSVEATDSDAVDRCLANSSEKYGRLDGVVNCVHSLFLKAAHATRDEDWAEVLAENSWVTGQMLAVDGGLSTVQPRSLIPASATGWAIALVTKACQPQRQMTVNLDALLYRVRSEGEPR